MSANANVIKNSVVYVAEYDMSGDENEIQFTGSVDAKEATVMTDKAHVYKPGLTEIELVLNGYNAFEALKVDDKMFAKLGTELIPLSILPVGMGTLGNQAYLFRGANLGYESKVTVGEMPTFKLTYKGNAMPVVSGVLIHLPAATSTFPHTGTGVQVGAITALQKGYANLHVLSVTGTGTLTVTIASAATLGGSYTDRLTFTDATGATAEWKSVNGAITDTFWRVEATVSGITAATFAVTFGIV